MNDTRKLQVALRELLKVLTEEKKVLITNDAVSLEKIVAKKNELIQKIETEKHLGVVADDEVRRMGAEIQRLQEINQLLTKQALGYQEEILKSLAKNNTSKFNTYSAKGNINTKNEVSIVDQSV